MYCYVTAAEVLNLNLPYTVEHRGILTAHTIKQVSQPPIFFI